MTNLSYTDFVRLLLAALNANFVHLLLLLHSCPFRVKPKT